MKRISSSARLLRGFLLQSGDLGLDLDHLLLVARTELHGDQAANPADDGIGGAVPEPGEHHGVGRKDPAQTRSGTGSEPNWA